MQTVDLRGVKCPSNFARAKLAIEMADMGEVIEFYLDEGEPIQSVSRSLKDEGHKLLEQKKVDGYYVLKVEVA